MRRGIDQGQQPTDAELWTGDGPESQWRLLLQLNKGNSFTWGDAGAVYFCIHQDDLQARRFERCWFEWECG